MSCGLRQNPMLTESSADSGRCRNRTSVRHVLQSVRTFFPPSCCRWVKGCSIALGLPSLPPSLMVFTIFLDYSLNPISTNTTPHSIESSLSTLANGGFFTEQLADSRFDPLPAGLLTSRRLFHDGYDGICHLLIRLRQLLSMKNFRQEGGWFQCSQNGPVVLVVHGISTGQHGDNARVLIINFLFLRLTDLQGQTLTYDLLANIGHGCMEVVHLGNRQKIGGDGRAAETAVRDFSVKNLISMVFLHG